MNSGISGGQHGGGDDTPDSEKNGLYDLVASAPSRKNWRGMLIAIFVICFILGLIITAVILMTPADDGPRVKGSRFTLDDALGGRYDPLLFNGTWLADNELLITDVNNNLQILDAPSGTIRPLLYNESIHVPPGAEFTLSADKRFLLLSTNHNKRPGAGVEFLATVHDLTTGMVYPVPFASPDELLPVQAIMWSPAPKNNALIYCRQNDIYYIPDITLDQTVRLTFDGSFNGIYNGIPDWTYREMTNQAAVWFSPAGDRLAYVSFNDTIVPEVKLPIYSEPDSFNLYTEQVIIRYPTPSSNIPRVSLRVVDLVDKAVYKELRPPLSILHQEHYLTMVKWVNDQRICAVWTVRAQNFSLISFCDSGPWHCQTVATIETGLKGWLDVGADLLFHPDGNSFLHLAPVQVDQQEEYYTNIVMVNAAKRHSWAVTQFKSEIHRLLGWDTSNGRNIVYYTGAAEGKTSQQNIYKLQINGQKTDRTSIECLTCSPVMRVASDLAEPQKPVTSNPHSHHLPSKIVHANSSCRYSNAYLSPSLEFYVHECLGPSIPYVEVRSLPTNRLVKLLQNNQQLRSDSIDKAFPRLMQLKVPLHGDNPPGKRNKPEFVTVELYLPPGFKEDDNTIYPLLVWTADEPSTVTVSDKWEINWATYMASSRDVIVAKVDLHGSQGSGHLLRNSIYKQPGVLEAVDLVNVTKMLQQTFSFISPVKTALFGAHYGGFLSIYTLANDPTLAFGCAVAVSPVTSWHTVSAPYAERYLGLLSDRNGQYYSDADLRSCTKNLREKLVFLLHGTLEEKFHVTHSMLFAKSMIEKRNYLQQQLYPDSNYGIMRKSVQMHEGIDKFLNTCFERKEVPEQETTLHKGD